MSGYGEAAETAKRYSEGRVRVLTQQYRPYDDYFWLMRHLGGGAEVNPAAPDPTKAGAVSASGLDR